jgi:hypothetical protein
MHTTRQRFINSSLAAQALKQSHVSSDLHAHAACCNSSMIAIDSS